jgi:hypothetical protein
MNIAVGMLQGGMMDGMMGGMSDIPQMGFVIIDAQGVIRVQRIDIYYGRNGGQILEIVKSL